jgi:hypothetical protein
MRIVLILLLPIIRAIQKCREVFLSKFHIHLNFNIFFYVFAQSEHPKASLSQDGYKCVYIISIRMILCNLKLGLSVSAKYFKQTEKLLKAVKRSHDTVMFCNRKDQKT